MTKADPHAPEEAAREAGLKPKRIPWPPEPLMHPNAEWCEGYARWHARHGPAWIARQEAALHRPPPASETALVEALERSATALLSMRQSIQSDVSSAHSGRGDGASEWMREDDREMRRDLRVNFDALASALAAHRAQQEKGT